MDRPINLFVYEAKVFNIYPADHLYYKDIFEINMIGERTRK